MCTAGAICIAMGAFLVSSFPQIVLLVPNVGWRIWGRLGQPVPGYFDPSIWASHEWLESGDVVIAVGTKCGTNWLMTTVHELRTLKLPRLREFEDISDVTPWAEFAYFPLENPEERRTMRWGEPGRPESWNSTEYKFRAFKSHFFPSGVQPKDDNDKQFAVLPVRERRDVKFIAMTRKSEDVLFSLFPFFATHGEEFRKLWGGFPPIFHDFQDVIEFSHPREMIAITEYARLWWNFRHEPNVLLLHYTDFYKNPTETIEQIAAFIGVQVTEQDVEFVRTRTSIDFMKARDDKYSYRAGRNRDIRVIEGTLVRAGGTGDYEKVMTKAQQSIWEKHVQDRLGDDEELLNWYKFGGVIF